MQESRRYREESGTFEENDVENAPEGERHDTSLSQQRGKEWFDPGYVEPASRGTEVANLAVLDPRNYDGFKNLDVNTAKLYLEHELPEGYHIIRRIGKGAFGCCFLIEKKLETVAPNQKNISRDVISPSVMDGKSFGRCLQMVLKVVHGNITPRRPVRFYKSCSEYTIMISHKALPLELVNLKFIIGILKYRHEKHREVHGDLNPGNMMYFPKDFTVAMWRNSRDLFGWESWIHASHIVQASLDFQDHWFSMEDEQITSIIDADIGGKIGEPKTLVSDLHHDPRNRTWKISDDLIGLMNWVVLKCGYSLRSHPQRGYVYGITLEHLKILYEHITDTYIFLDSKFIFTSIFASEEPFELKLEKGECYLDDLLKGPFEKFQKFKGSYSLSSSADAATSCVKVTAPTVVEAVLMSQSGVCNAFRKLTSDEEFLRTVKEVLKLLVDSSLHGGVIFLIVEKTHKDKLQIQPLDKGALTEVCRQHALRVYHPSFKHILGSFCAHSETDRWQEPLLLRLANALRCELQNDELSLKSLKNQPKDGAFVLSHSGTVLAAACRLEHKASRLELRKVDGTCVGTRHAASLGAAEWMRSEKIYGAVFVKSDAGSVHVFIPEHDQQVPFAALVDVGKE